MKKWALVLLVCLLSRPVLADDEAQENQCHDPKLAEDWYQRLERAPNDPILARIVALRLGLCQLIDEGRLDVIAAKLIFAEAVDRGVEERRREIELQEMVK